MKDLSTRARLLASARAFFEARGYLEVETPLLVPCPGLDVHLDAFEGVPTGVPRTGPPRFLITSPEYQMKRLLGDGHGRIFQITRAFRAGERGARHNPEFTILEFYRSPGTMADILRDTEQLLARLTGGVVTIGARRIDVRPPFARMSVTDAYARWAGLAPEETLRLAEEDEETFYRLLVDRVEPAIAELDHALYLVDYPACQASLARKKPGHPALAERFELYVAGVELCNGFGELTDPVEQRARFETDQRVRAARGKPVYPIDERFLEALAAGLPPSGGNAIGLDRVVALVQGTTEIQRGMAFADDEL